MVNFLALTRLLWYDGVRAQLRPTVSDIICLAERRPHEAFPMQPVSIPRSNVPSLVDAVDIAGLQRIQDTFAKAMRFAAVTVDRVGQPITRESGFLRLCSMIRSTEVGRIRCMQCDAEGGLEARSRRGPYVYVCKNGLIDIAAPIIIQDEYLGCILCGQVVPSGARDEFIDGILQQTTSLDLPLADLRTAVREIPSVPRERIDAAAEMLFQVANSIVEMGVANLTQAALLQETTRTVALQTSLHEAQLRMLESQINPHFLFNALGLISYSAIQENAHQTEEVAYCLSDLLRYSLRNLAVPVTLGQELEAAQRYLAIQRMRFGTRLCVEFDVDDTVRNNRMPGMILQPLVENAVVHAVEPLARPVMVQVRASRVPGGMQLEVVDDGVGMEPALLESLRAREFGTNRDRKTVGLSNVIRRLELEYGTACEFQIHSQIGHGTRVILRIPCSDSPTE
jgi:two-component system LytT family sensor kinase